MNPDDAIPPLRPLLVLSTSTSRFPKRFSHLFPVYEDGQETSHFLKATIHSKWYMGREWKKQCKKLRGKSQGRKLFGRPRNRWYDIIRGGLRKTGCEVWAAAKDRLLWKRQTSGFTLTDFFNQTNKYPGPRNEQVSSQLRAEDGTCYRHSA
jgi:hypothetical protein